MMGVTSETLRAKLAGASEEQLVNELFAFLEMHGQSNYDESVKQIEHALQCADLAQQRGMNDAAVTAALLHDLGHLLLDEHDGQSDFLSDDRNHEEIGARVLEDFFPPQVTEPIRLHVAAKRYLCTTDSEYYERLSAASKRSFQVQGGRLSPEEQQELERNPGLEIAVELRRIDDLGKAPGKQTPPITAFAECAVRSLRPERPGA